MSGTYNFIRYGKMRKMQSIIKRRLTMRRKIISKKLNIFNYISEKKIYSYLKRI